MSNSPLHLPKLLFWWLTSSLFLQNTLGAEENKVESAKEKTPHFVGPLTVPQTAQVDLRDLPKINPSKGDFVRAVPRRRPNVDLPAPLGESFEDPVRQTKVDIEANFESIIEFEGQEFTTGTPPDPVGAAGPNHYIQMVNFSFVIYDKSGSLLAGPSLINSIFAAAGDTSPCGTQNSGDPIVFYDQLADRWILSQFQLGSPSYECIAVSQTSDPINGGFHTYAFDFPQIPDYPKFGMWPDAYYMGASASINAYAFDRTQMLAGEPARVVAFSEPPVGLHNTFLPSGLDGTTLPPDGAPNYFFRFIDGESFGGIDRLEIFEFHVDFNNPNDSTFTLSATLPTAAFASLCNFDFECLTQPQTEQRLDSITEWPMWRLAYRNFGDHQSMVTTHTVSVGNDQAGVRWYELRKTESTDWQIFQQGTWAPDGDNRWLGSSSMDQNGNFILGYNVSSETTFPSLRYTGRLANDTLGELRSESVLFDGTGSQTMGFRWGDYTAMSIDPTDDCTFWFTGEYFRTTSVFQWRTRIGAFRFETCGPTDIFADGFESGDTSVWSATFREPSGP